MRKSGVDFSDPKAAAKWVADNPKLSRDLNLRALQAAMAETLGTAVGTQAGKLVNDPMGSRAMEEVVGGAATRVFDSGDGTESD